MVSLSLSLCLQKLNFLAVFGLTTLSQRDELLERKRKKRRKMMREQSPIPVQSKCQTPPTPTPTLSTRYTPEDMDRAPELENKKHFLNMFNLNHVSQEQKIGVYAHAHMHLYSQCHQYFQVLKKHFCVSPLQKKRK